jgi:hypothetical protein
MGGVQTAWLQRLVQLESPWRACGSSSRSWPRGSHRTTRWTAAPLYQAPTAEHRSGPTTWGAMFSVVQGARVHSASRAGVSLSFRIGGTLGALADISGGWVDEMVMRAADLSSPSDYSPRDGGGGGTLGAGGAGSR